MPLYMSPPSRTLNAHELSRLQSYQILDAARQDAAKKSNFNSDLTRRQLSTIFRERFGALPHDWQLDATEAILLGLDTIVIAGTGAGKTMPFMMPLLVDDKKKIIIISPLKILQDDQVFIVEIVC